MTIVEAITRFEQQQAAAQAILDTGFGAIPGESNRLYEERRELAQIALAALRCQTGTCPHCGRTLTSPKEESL